MKRLLTIVFWSAAILMVAAVVMSMGYRFTESLFIGTLFLPGALAVKYFYPMVSFNDKASGVRDTVFITIGVILGEILLFIIAHYILQMIRDDSYNIYDWENLPDILSNPVFIAIIIAVLSAGN